MKKDEELKDVMNYIIDNLSYVEREIAMALTNINYFDKTKESLWSENEIKNN